MELLVLARRMRHYWLAGYALATALVALAFWSRLELGETLQGFPFLTFFVAILLVAFLGGWRPAALAAVAAAYLSNVYLIGAKTSPLPESLSEWIATGFFLFTAATIIWLVQSLAVAHEQQIATERELRSLNTDLESRVRERTAELEIEMAERIAAEANVRQLQKMESIGQLTGGIAHDFNNMLAVIIGCIDLAMQRLTGNEHPRLKTNLEHAAEAAQKSASLTARMLAYSRRQPLTPQVVDINALVRSMEELIRRTIGEQIKFECVSGGGVWRAFIDPSQLENAILNLAINARDAMPDGGNLTIETGNCELDDYYARTNDEVEPGQYVGLSVTDTGAGMSPEVRDRAFDPFFTTKEVGAGTGLGLSQVYGFVKQSGGHAKIYSEIAEGTTIKLYLPRHLGVAGPGRADSPDDATDLPRGTKDVVILVVEDEEQVRRMTCEALESLGYGVRVAANADEALILFKAEPIDLLFTDIVMPGRNGRQLADEVLRVSPETLILFTTGYTRNAVVHNGILDIGVSFLPKPFTVAALARKVRDTLDGRGVNRAG